MGTEMAMPTTLTVGWHEAEREEGGKETDSRGHLPYKCQQSQNSLLTLLQTNT